MKTKVEQARDFLRLLQNIPEEQLTMMVSDVAGNDLCEFFREHVQRTYQLARRFEQQVDPESFMLLGYMMAKLERPETREFTWDPGGKTLVA